jgi:low affinity Fe/Cu permease
LWEACFEDELYLLVVRRAETWAIDSIEGRSAFHGRLLLSRRRAYAKWKGVNATQVFTAPSNSVARGAGSPVTFTACCAIVLVWAATGPVFVTPTHGNWWSTPAHPSWHSSWFFWSKAQNRDGAAIQAKLDELIRVSGAQNAFIGIEHLTEKEVEEFRDLCARRAAAADAGDKAVVEADKKARQAADAAIS